MNTEFGLQHLWIQGDLVTRCVGLLLLGMAPCAPFVPALAEKAKGGLGYIAAFMLLASVGTVPSNSSIFCTCSRYLARVSCDLASVFR